MALSLKALLERHYDQQYSLDPSHLVLVLDKEVQQYPWESLPCLLERSVSRVPSWTFLRDRLLAQAEDCGTGLIQVVDRQNVGYLLNPSGDLKHTECEFREFVKRLMF